VAAEKEEARREERAREPGYGEDKSTEIANREVIRSALDDTCDSITKAENITRAQLLAWNSVISAGCRNLRSWSGRYICVR
jgi:hypothetical protein